MAADVTSGRMPGPRTSRSRTSLSGGYCVGDVGAWRLRRPPVPRSPPHSAERTAPRARPHPEAPTTHLPARECRVRVDRGPLASAHPCRSILQGPFRSAQGLLGRTPLGLPRCRRGGLGSTRAPRWLCAAALQCGSGGTRAATRNQSSWCHVLPRSLSLRALNGCNAQRPRVA